MKKILSVFLAVVMAMSLSISISANAASQKTVSGKCNYSYATEVLNLINKERAAKGLSNLKLTSGLTKSAMIRGAELTVSFSHTCPNGDDCFKAFDYEKTAGENIAYGQTSPSQVVNAWMNSSGHKANILNSSFKTIGIGCFYYNGLYYWVQCFSGGTTTSSYAPSGTKSVTVNVSLTKGVRSTMQTSTATTTVAKPKATKITSLTAKSKGFLVKWSKVSGIKGYQIRYSRNKDMSNAKTITVTSAKTLSKTVKNLKPKKTYYVKVRTYKVVNSKKYYSSWTAKKAVKTKA